MNKKLRSYRFDESSLKIIEELKEDLQLGNNSAVLRRAIFLLKTASEAVKQDGKIIIRDSEGEREIVIW